MAGRIAARAGRREDDETHGHTQKADERGEGLAKLTKKVEER